MKGGSDRECRGVGDVGRTHDKYFLLAASAG
jgi:hypothetical protein